MGFLLPSTAPAVDKVVPGYPAALSGKCAKSGAECSWGIKGSIKWINEVNGGIKIGGKKVHLEYKVYDCESKKEGVTSLIERLITVDKVHVLEPPFSLTHPCRSSILAKPKREFSSMRRS